MSSSPTLPPQVSPPEFAVTATRPHALAGVDVIALPVLEGVDGQAPVLGPGAAEVGELLGVDLLAVLDADRASGKVGELTVLPVPLGAPDNAELRQVLLVGLGTASADDFRRAGATLARAVLDRAAVATTITAVEPSVGLQPFVVGTILGSFAFAWRKAAARARPGRPGRAGRPGRRRPARAGAGGRDRRGELAGPHARLGAVQPQEPRLARRPGRRAGRRGRARRSRSGTRSGWPTKGSAASSASVRPRRPRRG